MKCYQESQHGTTDEFFLEGYQIYSSLCLAMHPEKHEGEFCVTICILIGKRQSKRVCSDMLTDLDFADDIALISNEIDKAQQLSPSRSRITVRKGYCHRQ